MKHPFYFYPDTTRMPIEQAKLQILQQLTKKPDSSQRELAQALGISLGSVNYSLQVLIEAGCIKMHHLQRSHNKFNYVYLLTPAGLQEKRRLTAYFLECRLREYEALRVEIEALRSEIETQAAMGGSSAGAGV